MDGPFWVDLRAPHISADAAQVTMANTYKALLPIANLPVLGSNYFSYVGKAVLIKIFGRITTSTTPGNGQFAMFWGTGADNNGTAIATTAAFALTASQTNMSFLSEVIIRCRSLGATGSLMGVGHMHFNEAIVAPKQMIPATAPAATTLDLTANNVISPQFQTPTTTTTTITIHDYAYLALN